MERKTSYLSEMLTSQGNLYAVLGSAAAASLAAIPFGVIGAAIPLLVLGVGEVLAALVVPDLPSFRAKVDEAKRRQERINIRSQIVYELMKRIPISLMDRQIVATRNRTLSDADEVRVASYNNMVERINSLSGLVADRRSQLGAREIERLHEATIDYLSLWLARQVIDSRETIVDSREINRKIAQVDAQIRDNQNPAIAKQLLQARRDYAEMLSRRTNMVGKSAAIDAAMLAMPDKIEEIYQMIVAAPFSSGIGDKLEDSLSRLRLEEALEAELSSDLSSTLPDSVLTGAFSHTAAPPVASTTAKARAASKQSNLS